MGLVDTVVDTSTGDTNSSDILQGKIAYIDDTEVTGNFPTQSLSPGSINVLEGFYSATMLDTVDSDLTISNIVESVSIFGVIGAAKHFNAVVPETGQTNCYDHGGLSIPCAGSGQDGDLQVGVAIPSPRFTINGDGAFTSTI